MTRAPELWDRFVADNRGSFLQSWAWGEFQRNTGRPVYRFVLDQKSLVPFKDWGKRISNFQNPEIKGLIQFIEMPLPFGLKYWYGVRGPVVDESRITNHELRRQILAAVEKDAAAQGLPTFLRVDPAWPLEYKDDLVKQGWQETIDIQPRRNWVLDVRSSEELLLEAMRSKTRYNIRLAEKAGVNVRRGDLAGGVARLLELIRQTRERHGIRSHPEHYYQAMLVLPIAELWQAEYEGRVVASQIMIFFGRRATYLHGASSYSDRSRMAPYLLHWRIIQEAKRRGFAEYDLGGVDEFRWPGLTRFKQGFGGREEVCVGTFDFPLRLVHYALYTLGRALIKKR